MEVWILELALLLFFASIKGGCAINCFTCSSVNGSMPSCEDPFHPAMSNYTEKCMVPKQGHTGVFPANFCIKIVGQNTEMNEKRVIRACVMKTMDSQCGHFRYQDSIMTGCILTCDFDGCNSADHNSIAKYLLFVLLLSTNYSSLKLLVKSIASHVL